MPCCPCFFHDDFLPCRRWLFPACCFVEVAGLEGDWAGVLAATSARTTPTTKTLLAEKRNGFHLLASLNGHPGHHGMIRCPEAMVKFPALVTVESPR